MLNFIHSLFILLYQKIFIIFLEEKIRASSVNPLLINFFLIRAFILTNIAFLATYKTKATYFTYTLYYNNS